MLPAVAAASDRSQKVNAPACHDDSIPLRMSLIMTRRPLVCRRGRDSAEALGGQRDT